MQDVCSLTVAVTTVPLAFSRRIPVGSEIVAGPRYFQFQFCVFEFSNLKIAVCCCLHDKSMMLMHKLKHIQNIAKWHTKGETCHSTCSR